MSIIFFVEGFFKKVDRNGCPGTWEAPQSNSFDETSRICQDIGREAVLDDGMPHRALVLTKLIEWYWLEVGDENSSFVESSRMASVRGWRQKMFF